MRFTVTMQDDLYQKCCEISKARGDVSVAETVRYLVGAGIASLEREVEADRLLEFMDNRLNALEKTVRKENEASLEKAVSKLEKAVGKVSSIQKQSLNAASAANGSLIATITLMAHYYQDHPEFTADWGPVPFEDRWKLFFSTGRELAYSKDEMVDFYHAFKGAEERVGNEFANFADLYCDGDVEKAERLMTASDKVGFDSIARHSSKGR